MLTKAFNQTRQLPLKQNPKLVEKGNKYRHVTGGDDCAQTLILNISKKAKSSYINLQEQGFGQSVSSLLYTAD